MNIVRFIPNTLTSMNLVSGCVASTMALQGNLFWAMMWIIIASVFDLAVEGLFPAGEGIGLVGGCCQLRSGSGNDFIHDAGRMDCRRRA